MYLLRKYQLRTLVGRLRHITCLSEPRKALVPEGLSIGLVPGDRGRNLLYGGQSSALPTQLILSL